MVALTFGAGYVIAFQDDAGHLRTHPEDAKLINLHRAVKE
jgi:hypothetical protein